MFRNCLFRATASLCLESALSSLFSRILICRWVFRVSSLAASAPPIFKRRATIVSRVFAIWVSRSIPRARSSSIFRVNPSAWSVSRTTSVGGAGLGFVGLGLGLPASIAANMLRSTPLRFDDPKTK